MTALPGKPLCEGCLEKGRRSQRKCELVDGRKLCRECREELEPHEPDERLIRALYEAAGLDT